MIVVNFKNYLSGKNALELSKKIEKNIPGKKVIVCPANFDVNLISENTKLEVFSQHIDFKPGNKNTGFQNLDSLNNSNISGTLLNHSEHPMPKSDIKKILENSGSKKIILCVSSISKLKSFLKINPKPYAIAFEDPKLISTGKSIVKYNKKSLIKFIDIMKKTKIIPLCGAGISTEYDYAEALKLGCKGVLIASAIAKNKNPENLLKKLNEVKIK